MIDRLGPGLSESLRADPITTGLIALASNLPDNDVLPALQAVPSDRMDAFATLANHHRVLTRLALLLDQIAGVPGPVLRLVRELSTSHRVRTHVQAKAYGEVLDALRAAGEQVVVLKGYVLQRTCYPTPVMRPSSDLDLLTTPSAVGGTAEVLTSLGFQQAVIDHVAGTATPLDSARLDGYATELQHVGEFVRIDDASGLPLSIDLHFRLSTIFDHFGPNVTTMLENKRPFLGSGAAMLDPADLVGHLSYHSWWDTQSVDNVRKLVDLRLSHFADILRAMHHWDLTCADVISRAASTGIADAVHWALATTSDIFGRFPDDDVIDRVVADTIGNRLSDRWLQRDTAEPVGTWATSTADRVFHAERGNQALAMLMDGYLRPNTERGMRLAWEPPAS